MYKLLIADDETAILEGLVRMIDWFAIDCEVVAKALNGLQAQQLIAQTNPHIVVLDVNMPGMSGLAVASWAQANYPQTRVIILTGYADVEYIRSALRYGVIDYVLKPTNENELIGAVTRAIADIHKDEAVEKQQQKLQQDILMQEQLIRQQLLIDRIEGRNNTYIDSAAISNLIPKSFMLALIYAHSISKPLSTLIDFFDTHVDLKGLCHYFLYQDYLIAVIDLHGKHSSDDVRDRYQSALRSLATLGILAVSAFSGVYQSIDNLPEAYGEALSEMNLSITSGQKIENNIIGKTKEYLARNFHKKIRLDDIANHVHINSSHLCRLFKKETNQSPMEYLSEIRIEQAKKILRTSNTQISHVAFFVGIDDPTYFSALFKKHTGTSPRDYKIQHGQGAASSSKI